MPAWDRQRDIERKISGLRGEIGAARAREGVLTSQIQAAGQRIDALGGDIELGRSESGGARFTLRVPRSEGGAS